MHRQQSLFESRRMNLDGALELSLASLNEYGRRYNHWAIAYSGGKDSSAAVTFVAWAIRNKLVSAPESLTVMYADTRQELPPLQSAAIRLMRALEQDGIRTHVVLPPLDDRFYVYMLGRGVPPPKNRFRWCTPQLKIYPMQFALEDRAVELGMGRLVETNKNRYGRMYIGNGKDKMLMLTGVRQGESAARDQRIAISCSKDSGECGQGWFQVATPESLADTLAPLLHWRLCHVFDWLYFRTKQHGYHEVIDIADVYGDDEVRTGCVGCNLASKDSALDRLLMHHPEKWGHLQPLKRLKPLFRELTKPKWRKRKVVPEKRKDGQYSLNGQRLGPLTMAGREYGLSVVLSVQEEINKNAAEKVGIDLINDDEERRIREMWEQDVWPQKWSSDDMPGDAPIDKVFTVGSDLVVQPLLPIGS